MEKGMRAGNVEAGLAGFCRLPGFMQEKLVREITVQAVKKVAISRKNEVFVQWCKVFVFEFKDFFDGDAVNRLFRDVRC